MIPVNRGNNRVGLRFLIVTVRRCRVGGILMRTVQRRAPAYRHGDPYCRHRRRRRRQAREPHCG